MMARIFFGIILSTWLVLTLFRMVSYTPDSTRPFRQVSEQHSQFDIQHFFSK
ncbi:MAG: hypothetical protein JWP96_212 [Polaromonas sp.]|nr:hypothetical protein [Polaromonas sp.]